jgi:hypothetical protein
MCPCDSRDGDAPVDRYGVVCEGSGRGSVGGGGGGNFVPLRPWIIVTSLKRLEVWWVVGGWSAWVHRDLTSIRSHVDWIKGLICPLCAGADGGLREPPAVGIGRPRMPWF